MKKVPNRAAAVLILMALILVGMGVYIFRLVRDGGDWASFYANDSVYTNGSLNSGSVTDRNDVVLAAASEGGISYADSSAVRTACLHVVGDVDGNIGTGALNAFRSELVSYSLLTGTTTGGGTVKISIDADLNVTAYNALNGRKGAVLVYNYETGQILCMVSSPSYDP
ncbi:MAG: penicillin-binding protein, partial [Oscillospiraceae bacterium]|nr:penicillin-binding protein [Oscillospiraceae bacterium]